MFPDIPGLGDAPPELRQMALTHSSYAHEHPGSADNERLEFLGDAVLNLACSYYLYTTYPDRPEGQLTLLRINMVSTIALAERARQLGLGPHLRLGRGSARSGGSELDSILAGAFEALVGAIFLGGGWPAVSRFVEAYLAGTEKLATGKDNKTKLQEYLQALAKEAPEYNVTAVAGPDHARRYTVAVQHAGKALGSGEGRTVKEAEQAAARTALQHLGI